MSETNKDQDSKATLRSDAAQSPEAGPAPDAPPPVPLKQAEANRDVPPPQESAAPAATQKDGQAPLKSKDLANATAEKQAAEATQPAEAQQARTNPRVEPQPSGDPTQPHQREESGATAVVIREQQTVEVSDLADSHGQEDAPSESNAPKFGIQALRRKLVESMPSFGSKGGAKTEKKEPPAATTPGAVALPVGDEGAAAATSTPEERHDARRMSEGDSSAEPLVKEGSNQHRRRNSARVVLTSVKRRISVVFNNNDPTATAPISAEEKNDGSQGAPLQKTKTHAASPQTPISAPQGATHADAAPASGLGNGQPENDSPKKEKSSFGYLVASPVAKILSYKAHKPAKCASEEANSSEKDGKSDSRADGANKDEPRNKVKGSPIPFSPGSLLDKLVQRETQPEAGDAKQGQPTSDETQRSDSAAQAEPPAEKQSPAKEPSSIWHLCKGLLGSKEPTTPPAEATVATEDASAGPASCAVTTAESGDDKCGSAAAESPKRALLKAKLLKLGRRNSEQAQAEQPAKESSQQTEASQSAKVKDAKVVSTASAATADGQATAPDQKKQQGSQQVDSSTTAPTTTSSPAAAQAPAPALVSEPESAPSPAQAPAATTDMTTASGKGDPATASEDGAKTEKSSPRNRYRLSIPDLGRFIRTEDVAAAAPATTK